MVNIHDGGGCGFGEYSPDLDSSFHFAQGNTLDNVHKGRVRAVELDERLNIGGLDRLVGLFVPDDGKSGDSPGAGHIHPVVGYIFKAAFARGPGRHKHLVALIAFEAFDFFLIPDADKKPAPGLSGKILVGQGELAVYDKTFFIYCIHICSLNFFRQKK
jgi:hypothetical protein